MQHRQVEDVLSKYALQPNQLELQEMQSGDGASGIVRSGVLKGSQGSSKEVAVKLLFIAGATPTELNAVSSEAVALAHASESCKYACKLLGMCRKDEHFCIVMKKYAAGSLSRKLDTYADRCAPPWEVERWILEICQGLAEMHEEGIVLHDLKPSNVLLDGFGGVVLADFGLARMAKAAIITETTATGSLCSTVPYMSPEALHPDKHGRPDKPSDIWSLGCTIYELLTGKAPWHGTLRTVKIIKKVVVRRKIPDLTGFKDCIGRFAEVLEMCFRFQASSRPTAQEILTAVWTICACKCATTGDGPPADSGRPEASGGRPKRVRRRRRKSQQQPPSQGSSSTGAPQTIPPQVVVAPPGGQGPSRSKGGAAPGAAVSSERTKSVVLVTNPTAGMKPPHGDPVLVNSPPAITGGLPGVPEGKQAGKVKEEGNETGGPAQLAPQAVRKTCPSELVTDGDEPPAGSGRPDSTGERPKKVRRKRRKPHQQPPSQEGRSSTGASQTIFPQVVLAAPGAQGPSEPKGGGAPEDAVSPGAKKVVLAINLAAAAGVKPPRGHPGAADGPPAITGGLFGGPERKQAGKAKDEGNETGGPAQLASQAVWTKDALKSVTTRDEPPGGFERPELTGQRPNRVRRRHRISQQQPPSPGGISSPGAPQTGPPQVVVAPPGGQGPVPGDAVSSEGVKKVDLVTNPAAVVKPPQGHPIVAASTPANNGGLPGVPEKKQAGKVKETRGAAQLAPQVGGRRGRCMGPKQPPLWVIHKARNKYLSRFLAMVERVKGIVNKLTHQNFDRQSDQMMNIEISRASTLNVVITILFEKALLEPSSCELYAEFAKRLQSVLPEFMERDEDGNEVKVTFRRILLNKCQEEFERSNDGADRDASSEQRPEEGRRNQVERKGEENLAPATGAQDEERMKKMRRRFLSHAQFIGELYKKTLLTEKIMHVCITKLLGGDLIPHEVDLAALCTLLTTIGSMIDHPKSKAHMDAYLRRMVNLSKESSLSFQVRAALREVVELRAMGWPEQRKTDGHKTEEQRCTARPSPSRATPSPSWGASSTKATAQSRLSPPHLRPSPGGQERA